MFHLFKHELISRWIAVLSWGFGLAGFASMYIAIYPEMADEIGDLADLSIYRAMGIDIGTFAGFIASVVVQIVPVILGVYVIMVSTQTLAGEDDDGTLELLVAMPVKRWQIVSVKAAAIAIILFLIVVILGIGSALTLGIVKFAIDVDVTPIQLFTALMGVYPLMLAFFNIGLFIASVSPNRRIAIGIMAFIYIANYLFDSVGGYVTSLDFLQTISLFLYVNANASVFSGGIAVGDVAVLFFVAAVFFGLAILAFDRRNVTVGQWIWRRGHVPKI